MTTSHDKSLSLDGCLPTVVVCLICFAILYAFHAHCGSQKCPDGMKPKVVSSQCICITPPVTP